MFSVVAVVVFLPMSVDGVVGTVDVLDSCAVVVDVAATVVPVPGADTVDVDVVDFSVALAGETGLLAGSTSLGSSSARIRKADGSTGIGGGRISSVVVLFADEF